MLDGILPAWLHVDKLLHFSGCLLLSIFGLWWLAVALGIGKEAYDQWKYGGWSWGDLLSDAVGIVFGFSIHLII